MARLIDSGGKSLEVTPVGWEFPDDCGPDAWVMVRFAIGGDAVVGLTPENAVPVAAPGRGYTEEGPIAQAQDLVNLARWTNRLAEGVPDLIRGWATLEPNLELDARETRAGVRLVARGRFEKQPAAPASWIDFVHELDPQPEALRAFARDLAREVEQVCGLATPGVTPVAAAGRDDEFSTLLTFEPRWQWFTAPDGAPLACAVAGDGPPVLLVHRGGSTDHADLGRLLVALAGEFTVYGLDRRGHGRSGPYQPGHTIEREFEDVAAVVDAIDGPVPVVGNGIGAVCALEAARLSDRINAVVAASPEFESNRRAIQALFTLPTDSPTATPPWFDWAEARGHDPLDGALETEMSALDAYRFAPDRFRSLATPVLIVVHAAPSRPAGESPQWKAARAIQAAVPGLRLVQTLDTHRLERVPEVMTLLRQAAAGR